MNRHPRISLDLLRAFRAAAAHLSFTRAARELFVTQSAISHAVRALSPALARNRRNPLRTPADLARHVRLDFETIVYGRSWYDWEQWSEAKDVRSIAPASTMRFSHYDQVIQAAIKGSGVAIGKWPHLATELRDGVLCAPFGPEWVARLGGFHLEFADGNDADGPVQPFVAWLREELRRDTVHAPALLGLPKPKLAATRRSVRNRA